MYPTESRSGVPISGLAGVGRLWPSIAKDFLPIDQEQACSRSPCWLFVWMVVCSSPCRKWPNNRKMPVDCPIVITSMVDTLSHTRPDQKRGKIGQGSLLHSWHWVLFLDLFQKLHQTYFSVLVTSRGSANAQRLVSNLLLWEISHARIGWKDGTQYLATILLLGLLTVALVIKFRFWSCEKHFRGIFIVLLNRNEIDTLSPKWTMST